MKGICFSEKLNYCLTKYCNWIKQLHFDDTTIEKEVVYSIEYICFKIKEIVKNSMGGMPSTAYNQLTRLIGKNIEASKSSIDLKTTLRAINFNGSFFRMREMDSIYGIRCKDMFHIPLTMRHSVKTHRYSYPGYPCLYLGDSIYGCWEELRRPQMNRCAVSRLYNTEKLLFLDLTIPCVENLKDRSYLKLMPIIIASMIWVEYENADYKPEYIIPQLLMEWLLKNRYFHENGIKKAIHGIVYHSTQINNEFGFIHSYFINYAIPVFNLSEKCPYCKKLCSLFKITDPTTNDHEKLKSEYKNEMSYNAKPNEWKYNDYETSDFGNLEKRLKDENRFPLFSISCKGEIL